MQREEKKINQDIKFQLSKDKTTKNHIEVLLLNEKFKSNSHWKTHQDAEEGLNSVTSEKIN